MTSVAYRNGVLAVDSLASNGGFKFEPPLEKAAVIELGSGFFAVVAGSGKAATLRRLQRWAANELSAWVLAGADLDVLPEIEKEDESCVFISIPGRPLIVVLADGADELLAPFSATGEFHFACGAMAAGCSAPMAVALCALYSDGCGFPVHVYDHKKGHVATLHSLHAVREWDAANPTGG